MTEYNSFDSEYNKENDDEWVETTLCSSNALKSGFGNVDVRNNPYSFKPRTISFSESERNEYAEVMNEELAPKTNQFKLYRESHSESNQTNSENNSGEQQEKVHSEPQQFIPPPNSESTSSKSLRSKLPNTENLNFETEITDLSIQIKNLVTEKLKPLYNSDMILQEKQTNKRLRSENRVLCVQLAKVREANSKLLEKLKKQGETIQDYQLGLVKNETEFDENKVVDLMQKMGIQSSNKPNLSEIQRLNKIITEQNSKIQHMKKIQLGQANSINKLKSEQNSGIIHSQHLSNYEQANDKSDAESYTWGDTWGLSQMRSKNSSPAVDGTTVGSLIAFFKDHAPRPAKIPADLEHLTEQNYHNLIYLIAKNITPGEIDANQSIVMERVFEDSRLTSKLILVLAKSYMKNQSSITAAITSKHGSKISQIIIKYLPENEPEYFQKIFNVVKYKLNELTFHPKAAYFIGNLISVAGYKEVVGLASRANSFLSNPAVFIKACKHFAGTHVIQAFIKRLNSNDLEWFTIVARAKLVELAVDKYGNYCVSQLFDKLRDPSLLIDNLIMDYDSVEILRADPVGKRFMKKIDLI